MNEQAARQIMLVRAIETADRDRTILSEEDRRVAGSVARELLATTAVDPSLANQAAPVQFVAMRAGLLFDRSLQRYPVLEKLFAGTRQLAAAAILLPLLAFVVGIAVDRIADPHRVDLLSAPLLGILAWNLLVYIGMLVWPLLPDKGRTSRLAQWLQDSSNRLLPGLPSGLHAALLAFSIEWRRMSRGLDAARIGRMLHVSAALFAVGATLSLYLRGFLTQYAAGWESTFLDPAQLQSILSVVFAPARAVFRLQPFSLADIDALRFTPGSTAGASSSGARWVHLYAATLLLLVILPRLLLAALAHWRARRLQQDFPLSLAQPYFRRLVSQLGGADGGVQARQMMQVLPYSFAIDGVRKQALTRIAVSLLGEGAQALVEAPAGYGDDPGTDPGAHHGAGVTADIQPSLADHIAISAVLFNLAATPETQNHGAFLEQALRHAQTTGRQLLVLTDESGYRARLGDHASGQARVVERLALWKQFCRQYQLQAIAVDLLDAQRDYPELDPAIRFGEPT